MSGGFSMSRLFRNKFSFYIFHVANMKTFLAVTLFFRILTFAFPIGGGPEDEGSDISKCDEVQPMSGFDSDKFFKKSKHLYVTHSRYGDRLGVCREFYINKLSNGTIDYNYDFNGNGKPERGMKAYTVNCTSTKGSEQNEQFSFDCIQTYDWDLEVVKQNLLKSAESEKEKAIFEEEIKKMAEGDNKEEFLLKVTVLSTDYKEYALIHRCAEIFIEGEKNFFDNYVVFNIQEGAGLPEEAKKKFNEYKWEEKTFATREVCKK